VIYLTPTVLNLLLIQMPDEDAAGHFLLNIPCPKLLPPALDMLAIQL
jgi:hypothetical protein